MNNKTIIEILAIRTNTISDITHLLQNINEDITVEELKNKILSITNKSMSDCLDATFNNSVSI
jgi:hypothetical protein